MVTDNSNREAKLLASFFRQQGETLTYKKGRRILASNIVGKVLYVKSGFLAANLTTQPSHTRARAYYTYGPGDVMQIRSLLPDGYRELVYVALTNATLYMVDAVVMWEQIHQDGDLAAAIVRDVVMQHELLTRRVENLSYRYASDKLIYRILNLAERFGVAKDGEVHIRIPVTHRQLGMFINMARESVTREMEKLVSRKLISYERQHLVVINPAGLVDSMHESGRTDWADLLTMADASKQKT